LFDYGARFYDGALGRFHKQDRFAEKYLNLAPYQYAANNPILFIDVNGDSINVGKEHRKAFISDLQKVFGDNSESFEFTESGNLIFNGDKKSLSKEQKKVYKGMNKLMSAKAKYSVSYETTYNSKDGSKTIDVNGKEAGGAMFYPTDNAIVISPEIKGGNVTSLDPPTYLQQVFVEMNTTTALFHEFGEVLAGGKQYRSCVVDYENKVRGIIKMKIRPPDPYHLPTPTPSSSHTTANTGALP